MMSVSRLLTILLQSQFDHRHLQLWKALLSQNPRIFYIVLFVIPLIVLVCLHRNSFLYTLFKPWTFQGCWLYYPPFCLPIYLNIFLQYFASLLSLSILFLEERAQKFFLWICICVLSWICEKIIRLGVICLRIYQA